jgi:hypothetical protein
MNVSACIWYRSRPALCSSGWGGGQPGGVIHEDVLGHSHKSEQPDPTQT